MNKTARPVLLIDDVANMLTLIEGKASAAVLNITIGQPQLRVMLELALLVTRVQEHSHLPFVLQGITSSMQSDPDDPSLTAGKQEILRLLYELLSGTTYDPAELDESPRSHLTLIKSDG